MAGAATTYSLEVRILLCPGCGGPIDVAPTGGAVRCKYCNAQSEVVARGKLAAFLPHDASTISEPERLARLRSQVGKELLPPPGIAHLIGPGGVILKHRRDDALAAWQSARKRTKEQSPEAADELMFLTLVYGNELIDAKDLHRHRALLESSLEAVFLPRHRACLTADLCMGALNENDLTAAAGWLALVDSHSDDLQADSNYRLARARLSAAKQDWDDVIVVLGAKAGDLPIHDVVASGVAVRRADAWEHKGRTDLAVAELVAAMTDPGKRQTVEIIVRLRGLAPQSFPQAQAQVRARAAEAAVRLATVGGPNMFATGKRFLALAPIGLVAGLVGGIMVAAGNANEGPWQILLWVGGGLGGLLLVLGLLLYASGKDMHVDAERARALALGGVRAIGTVLSVTDTRTVTGAVMRAAIRVRVERDGVGPYEAEMRMVAPPRAMPSVGAEIRIVVDPADPSRVAPET